VVAAGSREPVLEPPSGCHQAAGEPAGVGGDVVGTVVVVDPADRASCPDGGFGRAEGPGRHPHLGRRRGGDAAAAGAAAPTATATTAISPRAASPATAVPAPWCLHPDDAVVGAVVTVTIVEVLVGADGGEGALNRSPVSSLPLSNGSVSFRDLTRCGSVPRFTQTTLVPTGTVRSGELRPAVRIPTVASLAASAASGIADTLSRSQPASRTAPAAGVWRWRRPGARRHGGLLRVGHRHR
jgi:hypothetical protein